MPRVTLTRQVPKGPFVALPVVADSLDISFVAADVTNKEQFVPSGDDLIIFWNSGASPYTITITSVADPLNYRTGDIATYSLAAGDHGMYRVKKKGWIQADGRVYIEASNTAVKWAIVQL